MLLSIVMNLINNSLNLNESLYQEQILNHATLPTYRIADKANFNFTIEGIGKNPSCGDQGNIYIQLDEAGQKVIDVKFIGEGCTISQAGLSMLSEYLINKSITDLKVIFPGTVYEMLGINVSPSRSGCALLCYNALEDAIKNLK
jgi:nitrogen fixation NifU-like protein